MSNHFDIFHRKSDNTIDFLNRRVLISHVWKWTLLSHSLMITSPLRENCLDVVIAIVNTLKPRQNGRQFPDDIFKWITLNENVWISIEISLKFVPKGLINKIPIFVQMMAWRRPGDKPLSGPMMDCLLTHICITRPQWLNNITRYTTWLRPTWASYQIRKIAGCACAGNAGNVFPRRRFQRKLLVSDPGMHHSTCVTHVLWCMSGSLTCGDGESVPGIPGACAPAILRIW